MKLILLLALALVTVGFVVIWLMSSRGPRRESRPASRRASALLLGSVGAVTNFFDTLGVGSFAPTTSIFKLGKIVPDEHIPGTLNVGHALPTIAEAFIFIAIVEVEAWTLLLMIAASVLGAWFGAGIVARWPRRKVQIGMGIALSVAAAFFVAANLGLAPGGGEALALRGPLLIVGAIGNMLLGAFMTLGIGLYAPCLMLVTLLGMNPRAAFPIMMGSCAFLMPGAGVRFIRADSYDRRAALWLSVGGVPAVLVAAFIVKSLPLVAIRWMVVIVVLYAAGAMLLSARREKRAAGAPKSSEIAAAGAES